MPIFSGGVVSRDMLLKAGLVFRVQVAFYNAQLYNPGTDT